MCNTHVLIRKLFDIRSYVFVAERHTGYNVVSALPFYLNNGIPLLKEYSCVIA